MSDGATSYSFLPWARQGLGTQLRDADQDTSVPLRASIDVTLQLTGERITGGAVSETIPKSVALYGPGDVVGIDRANIFRTEPRHQITNFETNYLPFVEFYEEDFCWRYTPAKASIDARRLRPWLALAVLKESEFRDAGTVAGSPLPVVEILTPAQVLPPPDETWAWAHVHVNGPLGGNLGDTADMARRLAATVAADRDRAYSRLLCPRVLEANTGYHAFVIPAFESGRLAGIGKDPAGAAFATQCSWAEGRTDPDARLYPVYHRWYFRTGSVGDFEYLVRLLKPMAVPPEVGHRAFDVLDPDANLPAIPELGGILRLGGALRAPLLTLSPDDLAEHTRFEEWGKPYPHPFQRDLAALVNLAADYGDQAAADANAGTGIAGVEDDEDPLIVPPLYGRWHSLTTRLTRADGDPAQRRWVDELNLDPRHRVAAGMGTDVVQRNQETYVEAAWQQVGKVLEGNARIRFGQMALFASRAWHRQVANLRAWAPERAVAMTAPVQRRVLQRGLTVAHRVQQSTLPPALVSKVVRQTLRPRGRPARLVGFADDVSPANLLARANSGEVSAAPPKVVAPELPTGRQVAGELVGHPHLPEFLRRLVERPWLRAALLVLAAVVALLVMLLVPGIGVVLGLAILGAAIILLRWLARRARIAEAAAVLDTDGRTPEAVHQLPDAPGFNIADPGQPPRRDRRARGSDSPDAVRFKEALRNAYTVDVAERAIDRERPVREPLDLSGVADAIVAGIDPRQTVPKRVLGGIEIPRRIADQLVEDFGEVMAYPEIDTPMYEPLTARSSEFFLPNIHLLPENSITLLETNQKFVEAYMVGLNHEFARELLWREYPTDQRGSYFRQFWDVTGFLVEPGADPAAQRERLRDIPELHRWATATGLGEHDHREEQGDKEEEIVLAIRGELLKKYPTAVIYAHRAEWERNHDGSPDRSRPRKLADLPAGTPPRHLIKTPLYEAKVDPDIYFFGFDLTAESAKGETPEHPDDPGWFFVLKERPGEPRFGLDLPRDTARAAVTTWNELAWSDVMVPYTPGAFLRPGQPSVTLADPGAGSEAKPQHDEDRAYQWRADTTAAELAYILYQLPVLMAVHAAEMLKRAS